MSYENDKYSSQNMENNFDMAYNNMSMNDYNFLPSFEIRIQNGGSAFRK